MHFDQNIIFIIIAAIIGISRLVAHISEESKKQSQRRRRTPQSPQTPPEVIEPIQRVRPKTDQERVREFLEALGQPTGAAPPPKVQSRTEVPPRPLAPVRPPISTRPFAKPEFRTWKEQVKEIVVSQQPTTPKPPEIKRTLVPPPVPVTANEPGAWIAQEQAQAAAGITPAMARASDQPNISASADAIWKQTLRTPAALRTAIILREIFGPPRALQSSKLAFD
jgi:hypothetical protein